MSIDLLFITMEPGLLLVDIPANLGSMRFVLYFWIVMSVVNLVLGILKRIPFL
jgi:hypothetical protein